MIEVIKKTDCTGCSACFNICPQNCIEMVSDDFGFWYPKVDKNKCTECGLCVKTCPLLTKPKDTGNWKDPKVYAAWSLNEQIRLNSTSGGVFSELATKIISDGGIVVGAVYNQNHLVEHYLTENIDEITKLRQSKYIQSDIKDIYRKIQEKLNENRKVAFCGSPCQVIGLKSFLKKKYEGLTTFDFV